MSVISKPYGRAEDAIPGIERIAGLLPDMPMSDYHAMPALSASGLQRLAQSPAHYYGLTIDPHRPASEPTPAMLNGTLVHCALFEPEYLAERYIVKPEGHDGRTKEGKAWPLSIPAGLTIINRAQLEAAMAQAEAIRRLPEIGGLLKHGEPEQSAFWRDEKTGELCKCRPDLAAPAGDDGVILLDGKTCKDASERGFSRSVATYGYHRQAAWYSGGYELATGKRVLGFVFLAVENTWPYAAAAYMLDDETLAAAHADNRRLLDLYSECKRSGEWPGYSTAIGIIGLPAWAMSQDQEQSQ